MNDVVVIGGGPAGLSAALFTAKNGLETVVLDTDKTWLHQAHLFNYLGHRSIAGEEFLAVARGQASDRGATIHESEAVESVATSPDGFTVTSDADEYETRYVVFATGTNRDLATDLGCETTVDDLVDVDLDMETSVTDAYATGAMVRAEKWQAVISAGDGAAAALDILSKERGEHFHDFDTPGDVPEL